MDRQRSAAVSAPYLVSLVLVTGLLCVGLSEEKMMQPGGGKVVCLRDSTRGEAVQKF